MKLYVCALLLLLPLLGLVNSHGSDRDRDRECNLEKALKSLASTVLENAKIACDDFKQNGAYSSCPSDYTATACSCGSACGSWDIQPENKCHCQCAKMDWTSARCCKIASK